MKSRKTKHIKIRSKIQTKAGSTSVLSFGMLVLVGNLFCSFQSYADPNSMQIAEVRQVSLSDLDIQAAKPVQNQNPVTPAPSAIPTPSTTTQLDCIWVWDPYLGRNVCEQ